MQKLSIAVAGVAFIVLGTVSVEPVQAALLDFNFTTTSGATGSFTLNTDTKSAGEPALFRLGATGISYPNAVSNFSFSAPYLNLSSITTDFNVATSITSELIGLPANLGVVSGVSYPPGCITSPGLSCIFDAGLLYTGNQTELPVLSDDPNSYSTNLAVNFYNPTTQQSLVLDNITNVRVVNRQVPESNSGLSILVSAIGAFGLLMKRNLHTSVFKKLKLTVD